MTIPGERESFSLAGSTLQCSVPAAPAAVLRNAQQLAPAVITFPIAVAEFRSSPLAGRALWRLAVCSGTGAGAVVAVDKDAARNVFEPNGVLYGQALSVGQRGIIH